MLWSKYFIDIYCIFFFYRTLLFDTGPVDFAIGYNGKRLGINFEAIDAIMISHGHWDHAGISFYDRNVITVYYVL